jgi:hypothetical protein
MKQPNRFKVSIGGERLMMHNEQLANPFNAYTQELARFTHKRNKTLEDHEEIARIEFQGGLYFDDKAGPFIPAHCLHKMMVEGAKRRKLGKQFSQSLLVEDEINPVLYEGPRTRDGLWKARDRHADQRLVGISQKRTLRTRPLFRDWLIEFTVRVTDSGAVNPEDIRSALEAAESIGLGDGRPIYGGQFVVRALEVRK